MGQKLLQSSDMRSGHWGIGDTFGRGRKLSQRTEMTLSKNVIKGRKELILAWVILPMHADMRTHRVISVCSQIIEYTEEE